jgi:hypothetical protein
LARARTLASRVKVPFMAKLNLLRYHWKKRQLVMTRNPRALGILLILQGIQEQIPHIGLLQIKRLDCGNTNRIEHGRVS